MAVHGPTDIGSYDFRFVAVPVQMAVCAACAALDLAGQAEPWPKVIIVRLAIIL
jgi:NO-binding membrane sensor protein with MHYT domain